jgi:lipopolysaccharide transport system permease protein
MVQLGLYISPIGFSSSIVPEHWRLVYALNPMVGVIDGFRWCILGQTALSWYALSLSVFVAVIFSWLGLRQFRNTEKAMADFI